MKEKFLRSLLLNDISCIYQSCSSLPQTISLLVYARGHLRMKGPFLVLCPLTVIEHWEKELKR